MHTLSTTPLSRPASAPMLPHHFEVSGLLAANPDAVFTVLDDFTQLGSHMTRSSWMMAGSRMRYDFDSGGGRELGSLVRLRGAVLGIPLSIDEVVSERVPGVSKAWDTLPATRIFVLEAYRMGFRLAPAANGSRVTVYINYLLPAKGLAHWLGRLLGHTYSRWCVRVMVREAVQRFG